MTTVPFLLEELAEFLAKADPKKVLAFRTSAKAQERLEELLRKNKGEALNESDKAELEQLMWVERIVSLAKVKALKLTSASAI